MTYQQPNQQVIYQQVVKPPTNGLGVASLILGIVAIVIGVWSIIPILGIGAAFTSFVPAVLAVVFGHLGVNRFKTVGVGKGQALTGLILGYVTLAIIVITTLFWVFAIGASAVDAY